MERPSVLAIALWVGFSSMVWAGPPDESWRRIREGEGIAVYVRDVADSEYDESLAQAVMKVRLSALAALIMDGNSHHRWIDTIDESRQIDRVSPTEAHIYTLSGAPWPVSDRDAVVLSRVEQDSATLVVTIESSGRPDYVPAREGTVRVPRVASTWTLVPQPDGQVEVNYRVFSEPGGELPTWLINSLASDQPFNTLANLRRFLSKDNDYRDAVLPYIKEPGTK